jgi:hypothetical protein
MRLLPGQEESIGDAKAVAQRLGMPFYLLDLADEFRKEVIEHFTASYEAGLTPNPCVVCNRRLKFGALLEAALSMGCQYVVTGHYARIEEKEGRFLLKKAAHTEKDQSYFLYALNQRQMAHIRFPLGNLTKEQAVSVQQHEREWDEIFDGIHEYVDACAFQDGHIDYDELDAFFSVNKKLADKYGMQCWTNAETFDRDMPIRFLPIKFDKLRMKLEAAKRCGYDKAITFEFSHFMSPQSAYLQAGHLYDRYREYFGI